jgi:uncharacterized protein YggE
MSRTVVLPTILAAIASPAMAAEIQLQAQGPVVELSVTETVKARPDLAAVGAGVTAQAATAVEAMQKTATAMDAVVRRIKSLGIADEDIQTTGINLGAQYDYDQVQRIQVFRGYQASNRVSVILRKVADTGRVLDALVAAGATDISGPSFSIDDDTAQRGQARKNALDKAKRQAEEYARWAGYSGVRLLQVSELVNPGPPMPYMERAMVADAKAASSPVEPGLVGTAVTVNVSYEMTR